MTDLAREWDVARDRAVDVRAEQAVLGAVFHRPSVLDWLELEPGAFWDPRHSAIWSAMRRLHESRRPVDEVTLAAELQTDGRLQLVGGLAYIGQLALRVPTSDNLPAYVDVLRQHLVTRRLLYLAASLPGRICAGAVGEQLLSDLQLGLGEIEPVANEGDADWPGSVAGELRATVEGVERRARGETAEGVIPLGISHIDQKIGGMPIGSPTVLGARPKVGKSSLALCIALSAARRGQPTHVITLEDKRPVWTQRALAQVSYVDVNRIASRQLTRADITALTAAADELAKVRGLRIDHGHGLDVLRLVRLVRARRRDLGTRLVILDYLQLVPHAPRADRTLELDAAMNAMAELAGRDNLAVLVLSQLKRRDDESAPPTMSDFRGSGAIEAVGKLILALHPAQRQEDVELYVLANHQGPTARFVARWDAPRCWIGG